MRFKCDVEHLQGVGKFYFVPLLNVVFLLLIYALLLPPFVVPANISVNLPKALTSDVFNKGGVTVLISGENLIHVGGKVLTIKELDRELATPQSRSQPVLIKADRRASLGRIVDVWDLCRKHGIERINVATTH